LLVRMTTDEVRPEKDRFRYKHAIDGLIRLVREEGVSALARGMSANVVSASPRPYLICLPMFSPDPSRTHECKSALKHRLNEYVYRFHPTQVLATRIVSFSGRLTGLSLAYSYPDTIFSNLSSYIRLQQVSGEHSIWMGSVSDLRLIAICSPADVIKSRVMQSSNNVGNRIIG
jgi:hypothetical protein